MGLFDRIGLLVRSNLNSMVSKAEDPEKILNQLLIDMREQFIAAKKQVAVAIADEKRLHAKMTAAQQQTSEWEEKAMLAVRKGADDLAREALTRQAAAKKEAEEWQTQWVAQKQQTEKLRDSLKTLQKKIDEAKRKKDLLIARAKRAEAQKTIQQTMGSMNDNSAFDAFGRMTEKVEQIEAEADATAELAGALTTEEQSLDAKFAALESEGSAEDALAALKAKMGMAPQLNAPAQLGHDDEFPVPDIGVQTGDKQETKA